jgi:PAS domain S-box-containing protein
MQATGIPASDVRAQVRVEQVRMLYRLAPVGSISAWLAAALVYGLLLQVGSDWMLHAWFAGMTVASAARLGLYLWTRRVPLAPDNVAGAEWRYIGVVAVLGGLWSCVPTVLFPFRHPDLYFTIAMITIGVGAGGVGSMGMVRRAYAAFLLPFFLPFAGYMLVRDAPGSTGVAIGIVLFLPVMLGLARRMDESIAGNLARRFELDALTMELTASKERTERANASLQAEIANRERAERETRHHTDFLDRLLAQTPVACVQWDPRTYQIKLWNPAAERMFGFTPEQTVGRSAFDVFVEPRLRPNVEQFWLDWREGRSEIPHGVLRSRAKDGRSLLCDWYNTPFFDGRNEMADVLSLVVDVTSREEVQRELRKARDVAETASRAKSQFLANMSHEIRTPMNGVLGMAELLLGTGLDERQASYAQMIQRSGQSLLAILNDILDFSKIEAGRFELDPVDFDLYELVGDVTELFAERARAKGLKLDFAVDAGVPEVLYGDRVRVNQVLTNLVSNAVKFTTQGSVSIAVQLAQDTKHEVLLRFVVTDTGIGVAPSSQDKLFQAFSQADGSMARRFGGTGLGLAISRQLAELMGGGAGMKSAPGAGSSFWFTVRLARSKAGPEVTGRYNFVPAPMRKLSGKVLLAEDNPVNQLLAMTMLRNLGLMATHAADGADAVARWTEGGYDLVLMDCQMPEMDGYAATAEIRAREVHGKRTPIVALTAHAMPGDRERCLAAGMDDYLTKPFRQEQLAAVLGPWLAVAHDRAARPGPVDAQLRSARRHCPPHVLGVASMRHRSRLRLD